MTRGELTVDNDRGPLAGRGGRGTTDTRHDGDGRYTAARSATSTAGFTRRQESTRQCRQLAVSPSVNRHDCCSRKRLPGIPKVLRKDFRDDIQS